MSQTGTQQVVWRKKEKKRETGQIKNKKILLATGFSIVDVFGADFVQPADELVERLAVNHQTADAFGIVGNNVGRPYIFPVI